MQFIFKKKWILQLVFFVILCLLTINFGLLRFSPLVFAIENKTEFDASEKEEVEDIAAEENEEDTWEFDEDWEDGLSEESEVSDSSSTFTWRLETAFRNYVSTIQELPFEEAYKKGEFFFRLEMQYGDSNDYLFSLTDLYFYPTFINDTIGEDLPYSQETETYRGLRISSESVELNFRELYYNWTRSKFRVRAGNQLFSWGTADFLNPTSYFNPMDLRELLFKDQEEIRFGVPSLSGLIFFESFTFEAVFVPVHVEAALPSTDHFWAVKTIEGSYPVVFGESESMDVNSRNFGYGARTGSTYRGIDFSLSGYHGPDNQPLLVPYNTLLIPNQAVAVVVQPQYFIADFIGFDFSFSYDDFVLQFEAAFSPNKTGFVKQDTDQPQDITFPFDTRETDSLSYSVGLNYFIPLQKLIPEHGGESLFTVEWHQSQYFDDDINPPQIRDLLTCRFQDTYFDERVSLSLTGIFEFRRNGTILWPQLGYDFLNGFKVEAGYIDISGHGEGDINDDSIFYYFRDNDFVMVNFLYAF